jgi:energy-coupling factor transport system ATP-binding protein
MNTAIRVRSLVYAYPDGTPAINDISLDIAQNSFVALIGQNGAGKTTFSKCLNGLLKPSSGSIEVEDLDTRTRGVVKKLVTRIGYVFQNPDHQLFNNSVEREIAYGPRNIGLAEDEVRRRVEEAAAVAGLGPEMMSMHPFFLTKGIRQRVAIASILALKPHTIIVDEPTTGQDIAQSLEVMNFLQRLNREQGHTIIIVTHEMPIVARYAQRVIALSRGRVLLDGSTREVFAQPALLRQTFVEPPQITRIAQALDGRVPRDVLSVEEMQSALTTALQP